MPARRRWQPPVEEGGDGDLVGRVEHARVRPPALTGAEREPQHRERLEIGRFELERETSGEVERLDRRGGALGIRKSERDRDAHVRIAEMRERRAVPEADERVDDRARMDDNLDPVVRKIEEKVGLDQLEPLVGERCRVDCDLGAHVPGRMRERVLRGYVHELAPVSASERSA